MLYDEIIIITSIDIALWLSRKVGYGGGTCCGESSDRWRSWVSRCGSGDVKFGRGRNDATVETIQIGANCECRRSFHWTFSRPTESGVDDEISNCRGHTSRWQCMPMHFDLREMSGREGPLQISLLDTYNNIIIVPYWLFWFASTARARAILLSLLLLLSGTRYRRIR